MDRPTRRRLLHATGLGLGSLLAGCQGHEEVPDRPGGTATSAATTTPTTMADGSTVADGGTTVHLLTDYTGPDWNRRWEAELVPTVREDVGVRLDYEFLGLSIPHEKRQRVEGLRGEGRSPDALTSSLWAEDVGYFLARGWLDPVTEAVRAVGDGLGPLVGEPATVAGDHYVVPHGVQATTIHYRSDVLADLGLDPPTTLESLLHNARVIAEETDMWGFAFPDDPPLVRRLVKLVLNAHGAHLWRWADGDRERAQVWFPQGPVRQTVEYVRELAETSWDPRDPSSPGPSYAEYAEGRAAQLLFLNAFGAEIAAEMGEDAVVEATELQPFPPKAGREPFARDQPGFDGFLAFADGDGRAAVDDVVEYLYRDPERVAGYYEGFATQYLPAWRTVLDSDRYHDLPRFRAAPHVLELVEDLRERVLPLAPTSEQAVLTPATAAAERYGLFGQLLRDVRHEGRAVDPAVRDARERLVDALDQGRGWQERP